MTSPTTTLPFPTYGDAEPADYRERFAQHERFADAVAALDPADAYDALVADFEAAHAEHRQYDGWTADAVLVRAAARISGKGGVKAEPGDYLLGHYRPGLGMSPGDWSLYAPRVGWNLGGGLPVEVVEFSCPECGYVIPGEIVGRHVPREVAHHPDCANGSPS